MNWSMRKVKTRKTSDFPGKSGSLVCNEYITPGIIKYPFWRMTAKNPDATYVCMSRRYADYPDEIHEKSIGITGNIETILKAMQTTI